MFALRKYAGSRRFGGLMLGALLLVPAGTRAAEPVPNPEQKTAQATQVFELTLPLIFQGAYLGDVPVRVAPDGKVSANVERIVALLGQRVTPQMADELKRVAGQSAAVPIDAFASAGVVVSYDAAKLELHASIPVDKQGGQSISAYDRSELGKPGAATIAPERFSGSLILTARQTYVWDPGPARGWEPFRLAGDLALNFFGPEGVYLLGQGEYDDGADTKFRRGNVALVHDDPENALRYAVGDVLPVPAGFQSSPILGGVSLQRLYGELQPFANVRPTGLYRFTLERAATVDVVVNGATIRTLRLEAGQYDLRDFPVFNGLNDIQLYVVDEFGRRLLATFSLFYSTRLLNEGIWEFGAAAGMPQERKSDGELTYKDDLPTFSGYVRYGLTQEVTVGANLQGNERETLAGIELGWGSPIGTFALLTGWSTGDERPSGQSYLIGYEFAADEGLGVKYPRFNLEYVYASRFFEPVEDEIDEIPKEHELRARFSGRLPYEFGLGLSGSIAAGHESEPDEHRYGISLGHSIGFGELTASYEKVSIDDEPDDDRFLLTLTAPLSANENIRASYDSRGNRKEVEYARFQRDELGDYGIRAGLVHDDDQLAVTGELDYNANRFSLLLAHEAIADQHMKDIQSQQSSYTIGTQIAFAGDDVAIGRPVGHRFAIVSTHDTLDDKTVGATGANTGGTTRQAEADALGPALISAGPAYLPQSVSVEVDDLPTGYDAGPGQYDVFPGLATGYAIEVGSDASHVVRGVLVDGEGKPLALLGGEIRAPDREKFMPVLVFTNSAGRFVTEGLAAGRYQMVLGTEQDIVVPLEVPENAAGMIDLGTMRVEGGS